MLITVTTKERECQIGITQTSFHGVPLIFRRVVVFLIEALSRLFLPGS